MAAEVSCSVCSGVVPLSGPRAAVSLDAGSALAPPQALAVTETSSRRQARDIVGIIPEGSHRSQSHEPESDPEVLAEAVQETARRLTTSRNPVIVAGVEIHRFGLQDRLLTLAEKTQTPITATMLGKSVVSETHPLYAGLYEGAMGRSEVTELVEESDCVLLLGAFMTDLNSGIYTANLDPSKCIAVTSESLRISQHHFHDVLLFFRDR